MLRTSLSWFAYRAGMHLMPIGASPVRKKVRPETSDALTVSQALPMFFALERAWAQSLVLRVLRHPCQLKRAEQAQGRLHNRRGRIPAQLQRKLTHSETHV